MSIRELIIFHSPMRLLERIDAVSILLRCKINLVERLLILFLIPISYLTNMVTY